ncbi:N-6 DNA Methylase [compost metagenome]
MRDEDIQKITNTYTKRKSIAQYSAVVDIQTIVKNEINLNIPRYIDTFIEIESVDLNTIQKRISAVKEEILLIDAEINDSLKKLR